MKKFFLILILSICLFSCINEKTKSLKENKEKTKLRNIEDRVPSKLDMSYLFPEALSQEHEGSCVCWSSMYYALTYILRYCGVFPNIDSPECEISPSYLFNMRASGGDTGVSYKILSKFITTEDMDSNAFGLLTRKDMGIDSENNDLIKTNDSTKLEDFVNDKIRPYLELKEPDEDTKLIGSLNTMFKMYKVTADHKDGIVEAIKKSMYFKDTNGTKYEMPIILGIPILSICIDDEDGEELEDFPLVCLDVNGPEKREICKKAFMKYGILETDVDFLLEIIGESNNTYCSYEIPDEIFKRNKNCYLDINGGHSICLVGWDNNHEYKIYDEETKQFNTYKGAFKYINSWGKEWGDSGYGWISYEFIEGLFQIMRAMKVIYNVDLGEMLDVIWFEPIDSNTPFFTKEGVWQNAKFIPGKWTKLTDKEKVLKTEAGLYINGKKQNQKRR